MKTTLDKEVQMRNVGNLERLFNLCPPWTSILSFYIFTHGELGASLVKINGNHRLPACLPACHVPFLSLIQEDIVL